MDFLNKAFAQLTDLFRSMTMGARITTALLLIVVVVSLAYLFRYHASGPSVYLMNGESFSADQSRIMEAAFAKANLSGWEYEGGRIRVPRSQQAAYMAALAENDALPEVPGGALDKALNSLGNPFMDGQHRQQVIKAALQKDLSRIIRNMKGIQNAWVTYDTDKKYGLNSEKTATAAVSVIPQGSEPLSPEQAASIRRLVSHSISGLQPEKVVVADLKNNRNYSGDGDKIGDATDNTFLSLKRGYEKDWQNKILKSLGNIDGALVSVNVDLAKERLRRERQTKPDVKPVPLQRTEKSRTRTHEGTVPAGRAGFQSNQPLAIQPTQGKGSKEEEEETTTQESSITGTHTTETEEVPMTPQRVTASVSIPTSYFKKLWQQNNPAAPGEKPKTPQATDLDPIRQREIARVEKVVTNLLIASQGAADVSKLAVVTEFEDIAPEEIPEPGMKEEALAWLGQYWSTLGLIFLALISLAMLRSMIRATPQARPGMPQPTVVASEAHKEEEVEEETPAERRLKRLTGTGKTLRDELSELVVEDPDAAANILRTWIGNIG